MIYRCCTDNRRESVRGRNDVNGIDYVEVLDRDAPPDSPRQRTLLVRFVHAAPTLSAKNFAITGGDRIQAVKVDWVTRADSPDNQLVTPKEAELFTSLPDASEVLVLRTDSSGDHSTYALHVVDSPASLAPPNGIDPLLARVRFSFKVECPSDNDCAPAKRCPPADASPPAISYLAKDYGSFRRLMLHRLAETIPLWTERNAADLGIALVETLAYVGDQLSYAQDAVATEAYIGTARRRSSVRRHARLVAYRMHDGANARVWVQMLIDPTGGPVDLDLKERPQFLSEVAGFAPVLSKTSTNREYQTIMASEPLVFEPVLPPANLAFTKRLFPELGSIDFYDWGDSECCLPRGAVRATLRGNLQNLAKGDVLIFEECKGPRTGSPADADPTKRCAVRLVGVVPGLTDIVPQTPQPITEIRWADEDALPFSVCVSSGIEEGGKKRIVTGVSRALGNIILADHGRTIDQAAADGRTVDREVDLGTVPDPHLWQAGGRCCAQCEEPKALAIPPRFRPGLPEMPITQSAPLRVEKAGQSPFSAAELFRFEPEQAVSAIDLADSNGEVWQARSDLLASASGDRHFVVEVEGDGSATLHFGDDRNGRRPESGLAFKARYRVGNGPSGNIGADALGHVVTDVGGIIGARNPLPASGGVEQESMAVARVAAPQAFRRQERAVTPADYAEVARRHPSVQDAAATFRWNGHGHTVFVTVDRFGGLPAHVKQYREQLLAFLEPYRMAGYDLEVDTPRFVGVDLALMICVSPDHFRSQVRRAVLEELSDQRLPDGRLGFFHPDNLTFGQPVYLSAAIARAQSVEGVDSVTPTIFGRLGVPDTGPLQTGALNIGRLEIACLSSDPDFPERGRLSVQTGGGK